jgi:hypothetical protein
MKAILYIETLLFKEWYRKISGQAWFNTLNNNARGRWLEAVPRKLITYVLFK